MNLTFDNLAELDDFLVWVRDTGAHLGGGTTRLVGTTEETDPPPPKWDHPTLDASGATFDTPQQPLSANHVSLDDKAPDGCETRVSEPPAQAAEPTKRKRRTKAEIEADEKAAERAAAEAEARHVDIARVAHADGSVTTTSVGLPPDVNPSGVTGAPAGANPFEQPAATAAADTPAADDGETVVTPFQHLTRAREFIAKHGMPKYNETFTKAELDANVMGYSAYQRALHMSAMDELDKA